jgi:hypothetical protein
MSTIRFDQVWEAVKTFTPSQRRRLRKLLDVLESACQPLTPEAQTQLLLLRDGLVRRVLPPATEADVRAFEEYQPVPIEGKPLSETIVEERR